MPFDHNLRRGHRAPEALAAAAAKRRFVRATPYRITTATESAAASGQLPAVRCHSRRRPSQLFAAAGASSLQGGGGGCMSVDASRNGVLVQSLAERFQEMRRTVMERLTCGIHLP
jgi:hypothetical protein